MATQLTDYAIYQDLKPFYTYVNSWTSTLFRRPTGTPSRPPPLSEIGQFEYLQTPPAVRSDLTARCSHGRVKGYIHEAIRRYRPLR